MLSIPKEAFEYVMYDRCQNCHKDTKHYGSELIRTYCSECGFSTSDDMSEPEYFVKVNNAINYNSIV